MIAAQVAFTYVPFMNAAFHSAPLDGAAWLRVIAVALAASLIVGFEKWVRARAGKSQAPDAHAGARAAAKLRP